MATSGVNSTNNTTLAQAIANSNSTSNKTSGTSSSSSSTTSTSSSNAQVTQQEFLTLLMNQLKNQDPLDPMKSEDFAVQLAQFSSLEQLVEINKKVGSSTDSSSSVATMASFLGQQVTISDTSATFSNGKGPDVQLTIPSGAQAVRVDLLNSNGKVVASKTLDSVTAGNQSVSFNDSSVADGTYTAQAVEVNANGQFVNLTTKLGGVVEGFVLEPSAALLVNGQQVSLDKVTQVTKASSSSAS